MKLLVFAHIPPPLHGQSQMVAYLVDGFRSDPSLGVEVVHVDARLSDNLADVGSARGGKLGRLLRYCFAALRARFRDGATILYYIPSPPKRASLYRDWIVLLLLRPWFGKLILHWHAVGLGAWLREHGRGWERWISHRLLDGADLAVVLSGFNEADAREFFPRRVERVANGVPDPCPRFAAELAPLRRAQREVRVGGGGVRVLFLAHCTRDKGLFDALEAVVLANRTEGRIRFRIRVAGTFVTAEEERAYRERVAQPDLAGVVEHAGFVTGAAKERELLGADVFLFPSYFANEGQPLNLIEAMAYGLPVVTTRWRGIPEMMPENYAGLVEPRDPEAAARALLRVAMEEDGLQFRERYERNHSLRAHLVALAQALRSA